MLLAYFVSSVNGFFSFRHFVFEPVSHPLKEYLRYQLVYCPLLLLNMIVLPLAVTHTGLNAYAVQALFAMFSIVASYLGNKYFTFRRRPTTGERERRLHSRVNDRGSTSE